MMSVKDWSINYLNNTLKTTVANLNHIEQKKSTRNSFQIEISTNVCRTTSFRNYESRVEGYKIILSLFFRTRAFQKKKFILMNQKLRPNAENSIEKDFFKLLNNANFGCDCDT